MAGAHAAASISTTLGVAAATVVVMGAILAGPTVLDCSKAADVAACLRDRIAQTGLLAPDAERLRRSDAEASDPVQTVAEGPRQQGWIEANAGEYEPHLRASAELTAPVGSLELAGRFAAPQAAVARVALAGLPGSLTAGSSTPLGAQSDPALLNAPTGVIESIGGGDASGGASNSASLVAALGTLDADAIEPASGSSAKGQLAASSGRVSAFGTGTGPNDRFADVALLESPGVLAADGERPSAEAPIGVLLSAPAGTLTTIGNALSSSRRFDDVALLEMPGTIDASGSRLPGGESGALMLVPRPGVLSAGEDSPPAASVPATILSPSVTYLAPVTGGTAATPQGEGAIVYLEAAPWDAPEATGSIGLSSLGMAAVVLEASTTPMPVSLEARPAAPPLTPASLARFPSVVLLPPPATGADSSFATLQVR